jgi:hypothetical protein
MIDPAPPSGDPYLLLLPTDPNYQTQGVKLGWDSLTGLLTQGLPASYNTLMDTMYVGTLGVGRASDPPGFGPGPP